MIHQISPFLLRSPPPMSVRARTTAHLHQHHHLPTWHGGAVSLPLRISTSLSPASSLAVDHCPRALGDAFALPYPSSPRDAGPCWTPYIHAASPFASRRASGPRTVWGHLSRNRWRAASSRTSPKGSRCTSGLHVATLLLLAFMQCVCDVPVFVNTGVPHMLCPGGRASSVRHTEQGCTEVASVGG